VLGLLFPDIFYTTLHADIHRITKGKNSDARLMQLRVQHADLKQLAQSQRDGRALATFQLALSKGWMIVEEALACLLGTIIMANIRHLQMTLAKLNALDMLLAVSERVDDVYK
jgi:hypothetical protein